MLNQWPIEVLVMFEEEEVGKSSIYKVGLSPGKLYELQSLLTTVPAPPEGCSILLRPQWPCVGLN